MKYLAALLLLVTSVAFAQPTHWVEITTSMSGKVYIDDANLLVENFEGGSFNGFKALIVFQTAFPFKGVGLATSYNVQSEILELVYDCHQQIGIAKRLLMTDDQKTDHTISDVFRVIDHAPATDILDAVKARVCFHSN